MLCSHFLLSYGNQTMQKTCQENAPEGHIETHKISFLPYKQVSERNGNHE